MSRLSGLPEPLKDVLRRGAYGYLRTRQQIFGEPARYLLVLSHMRSGSSLLHRILIGHSELIGAGERNSIYQTGRDFEQLAQDAFYFSRRWRGTARYAVDQINHDHLIADERLLLRGDVTVLFLARRPGPSIRSMVETFQPLYGDWPIERAVKYYVTRLTTLARTVDLLKEDGQSPKLVRYEDLTEHPAEILERLSMDLRLTGTFSTEYVGRGFAGRGDPGPRLRTGRIQPGRLETVDLPADDMRSVEAVYRRFIERFDAHRNGVDTDLDAGAP